VTLSHRGAIYEVSVRNPRSVSRGVTVAELDGVAQPVAQGKALMRLCEDREVHQILVTLG
jgi:hypothetical protein